MTKVKVLTTESMTGFARAEGNDQMASWVWELRSVNGKSLDLRLRLPSALDNVESAAREMLNKALSRGNVTANLNLQRQETTPGYKINSDLLGQLAEAAAKAQEQAGGSVAQARMDGLLSIRGVLELVEHTEDDEVLKARERSIIASLEKAISDLKTARQQEGGRLAETIGNHLDRIEDLCQQAEALASVQPAALKERLIKQVHDILDGSELSEDRLAHEVTLLVTKADVREELDRLKAHIAQARELMAENTAKGRRLDFLCQEFNREANTLCAKSSDVALTRIGMDLKTSIDQLREQIQNVE